MVKSIWDWNDVECLSAQLVAKYIDDEDEMAERRMEAWESAQKKPLTASDPTT